MDANENVVDQALVKLVRQVPWGPNRLRLEHQASLLFREATAQRGNDNYTSAAEFQWKAELYMLAAEVRLPRDGDRALTNMRLQLEAQLDRLWRNEYDDDIGEVERVTRRELSRSLPVTGILQDHDGPEADLPTP